MILQKIFLFLGLLIFNIGVKGQDVLIEEKKIDFTDFQIDISISMYNEFRKQMLSDVRTLKRCGEKELASELYEKWIYEMVSSMPSYQFTNKELSNYLSFYSMAFQQGMDAIEGIGPTNDISMAKWFLPNESKICLSAFKRSHDTIDKIKENSE